MYLYACPCIHESYVHCNIYMHTHIKVRVYTQIYICIYVHDHKYICKYFYIYSHYIDPTHKQTLTNTHTYTSANPLSPPPSPPPHTHIQVCTRIIGCRQRRGYEKEKRNAEKRNMTSHGSKRRNLAAFWIQCRTLLIRCRALLK